LRGPATLRRPLRDAGRIPRRADTATARSSGCPLPGRSVRPISQPSGQAWSQASWAVSSKASGGRRSAPHSSRSRRRRPPCRRPWSRPALAGGLAAAQV